MGAFHFNVFHILGDVSHTTSKLVLIWAIHSNSSAEGTLPPIHPTSPSSCPSIPHHHSEPASAPANMIHAQACP
jgi:hypothetical protein